jgi:hypothetical protein
VAPVSARRVGGPPREVARAKRLADSVILNDEQAVTAAEFWTRADGCSLRTACAENG